MQQPGFRMGMLQPGSRMGMLEPGSTMGMLQPGSRCRRTGLGVGSWPEEEGGGGWGGTRLLLDPGSSHPKQHSP